MNENGVYGVGSKPVIFSIPYKKADLYTCNVSVVFDAGSESVISFFNRANPFSGVCLFCNFVRNRISVKKI